MTLFLVDVSKYQVERADPLGLPAALQAGFGAVNIALDRGKAEDVLPVWAPGYAAAARELGLGISTYKWLDNRLSGAESARRAYNRIVTLGGPAGMAHVVDCEDNANEQTLRDYVTTMTALLGRPVAIYSGKWWLDPRGWRVNDLSPYLWAAPSAGYLGSYPGDSSPHWTVNYGGYTVLAAMQYAVSPLPFTGPCSLSAIRDPAVWTALTGKGPPLMRSRNMQRLTDQLKARYPGVVIYGIGDEEHKLSPSAHNEDDTPGSRPDQEDPDNVPEHRAIDVMIGPKFTKWNAYDLVSALVTHPANRARLTYVIFDGYIWSAKVGFEKRAFTGDPHHDHPHVNGKASDDENGSDWILDPAPAPTPQQEDEDMNSIVYVRRGAPAGQPQLWALAGAAAGPGGWVETDHGGVATGWALRFGGPQQNSVDVPAEDWDALAAGHRGA